MALERRLLSGRIGMPAFTSVLPISQVFGAPQNIGNYPLPTGNGTTTNGQSTGESTIDWDSLIDAVGGIAPNIIEALKGVGLNTLSGVTGQRTYNNVFVQNGKIKVPSGSGYRTLGYTPNFAKKKYKTRRRRKRLTKRDMAILAAIQQNPNASAALTMML